MARDGDELPELPPHLDPRREPAAKTKVAGRSRASARAQNKRTSRLLVYTLRGLAAVLSISLLVGAGLANNLVTRVTSKAGTGASTNSVPGNISKPGFNGEDMNILIVGNDSRSGYTDAQLFEKLGTTPDPGMNTDTMMLVHIPADGTKASVVSFPRDSYVKIPGHGTQKLNAAYALGYTYNAPDGSTEQQKRDAGQALLITTISGMSGMKIDHFVEVSLLGFFDLTQALGGIEVNLCQASSDPNYTGLELSAGKHLLKGRDALLFVRQRHGLAGGDLDRIKRQQYFFGAVIKKVLDQNLLDLVNISKLTTLVDALAKTISWDKDLSPFDLAEQMRQIAAGNVEFRTVPVVNPGAMVDGQSVVLLADDVDLLAFFKALNAAPPKKTTSAAGSSAPATVAPAEVTVDVLNGTETKGLATTTSATLVGMGFKQGLIDGASSTSVAQTTVNYPAGLEAQANTVLAVVPGAKLQVDPSLSGKVQLILGSNFTGIKGDPNASSAAATTTPPPDVVAGQTACVN